MVLLPANVDSALAWADRLYQVAAPLPRGLPQFAAEDALDAYRQVAKRFGKSRRTKIGIGNSLLLLGRYEEAAKAYPPGKRAEARHRAEVARRCEAFAGKRSVIVVERLPGTSKWIALFAKRGIDEGYGGLPYTNLGIREFEERGKAFLPVTKEMAIPEGGDSARHPFLFVTKLGHSTAVIVSRGFPAANCAPSEQRIIKLDSGRFRAVGIFKSIGDVELLAPSKAHPFRVLVTPTYKVGWPDVYEWREGRFQWANRRSPGLFNLQCWTSRLKSERESYPTWLVYGATLALKGKYKSALWAYRKAESRCLSAVRFAQHVSTSVYYTAGFYGDDRINLQEIRQRIRWLRRSELDHALLYRPYDWDLQVSPYKLGHAGDDR